MAILSIIAGAAINEVIKALKNLPKNEEGKAVISGDLIGAVADQLEGNPVLVNELNAEPLVQSRTMLNGVYTFLAGLFLIRDQVMVHGLNFWQWPGDEVSIIGYGAVFMGVYGMVGRAKSGLRPAFSWIGDLIKRVKGPKGA